MVQMHMKKCVAIVHRNMAERFHTVKSVRAEKVLFAQWAKKNQSEWKFLGYKQQSPA
jgi:hypothetical protein